MSRLVDFKEVTQHKLAFLQVRANNPVLSANISLCRALMHDTGKAINILLFGDRISTAIHRKLAGHHNFRTKKDLWEGICDWECARITKPQKPLDARGTWVRFYNHLPCLDMLDMAGL